MFDRKQIHRGKQKSPRCRSRGFFDHLVSQLANDDDVAGLQTLGALFDSELDLLAFLQVLEAFALDRREVDKDVIAAIASEKAVALGPVEPLDCTVDTFRHVCLLMAKRIYGGYSLGVASERLNGVKQSGSR